MPIATDNNWLASLLKIFDICRQELQPLEKRYHGPYTKLLTSTTSAWLPHPNPKTAARLSLSLSMVLEK